MLDMEKLLFLPRYAKESERGLSLTLKHLTILFCVLCVTNAELPDKPFEQQPVSLVNKPVEAPGVPDLPLLRNVPAFHRQHRKHFPHGAPWLGLAPAQPPDYGPLVTAAQPPSSSGLSKPSMKKSGLVPPSAGLAPPRSADIAPTQSSPSTLPAGLAQPPLSPHTSTPRSAMSPVEASPKLPSAPAVTVSSGKGRRPSLILIVGIVAGILIITIISTLFFCFCGSKQGQKKGSHKEAAKPMRAAAVPAEGSFPHPTSTRYLPYEELKEATNNFASSSILGEGGFGRVFKGVLNDGTAVAIKRLTNGGQQGDKEFLVEVEMLSRLHHRNLVKLVGYYSSRESSQNLLCYELVSNGSLEAWLHGPLGLNCPLDWDTRMKIALDAARGLAYLHEDSQPCVIHRDFKASNILLENNFHAKVADFGLAKQAPEGQANYLSTRVMGTFGYVAPEYAMTGHLLVKSDVYSYGVVLLELLTGKKPVDMAQPSGQENLVTCARPILRDKDRLEELADPRLEGKYPKEDFVRVCTIAAACVAPEASQRPTMGEVVQSLKMVQRVTEYQDTTVNSGTRPNLRQSSTTFESDGTSSMFSSGPYSGMSVFENDVSRAAVFSEDLHEGR
ncbi:PTI1-like tyrosine-protein kinase 2 isoform X2 [Lycium barbarum]|uniref:PTI1-like tyrosine-protein kinase 2 isoform X2 n=1 Tax=Lycium barbarum TaxID=112863 RepID=UPI00293EEF26|nr:PTI1-like tyrosine-protein kinase 2 isoform X2 [Lycium barbarum]